MEIKQLSNNKSNKDFNGKLTNQVLKSIGIQLFNNTMNLQKNYGDKEVDANKRVMSQYPNGTKLYTNGGKIIQFPK